MLVESGDFLFKESPGENAEGAAQRAKASIILRAYRLMGYDAVLPGEIDLAAGLPFLLEQMEKGLPLLCLNLVSADTGKPIFPRFREFLRGGLKVVVTGVLGEGMSPGRPGRNGQWRILPPDKELEEFLRSGEAHSADVILVLSHLGGRGNHALAQRSTRPLLVFGAHSRTPVRKAIAESGSVLFQPKNQGTHLIEATVGRPEEARTRRVAGFTDAKETERHKENLRNLRKEMEGIDPERRKFYEKAMEAYNRAIREAEGKIRLEHRAVPLDAGVPEDPKIAAMVADYTRIEKMRGDRER